MKPIIEDETDQRIYDWLVAKVGQQGIEEAIGQLAGNRRPYLTNIAKVLKLKIPKSVLVTPEKTARQHLGAMMDFLKSKH